VAEEEAAAEVATQDEPPPSQLPPPQSEASQPPTAVTASVDALADAVQQWPPMSAEPPTAPPTAPAARAEPPMNAHAGGRRAGRGGRGGRGGGRGSGRGAMPCSGSAASAPALPPGGSAPGPSSSQLASGAGTEAAAALDQPALTLADVGDITHRSVGVPESTVRWAATPRASSASPIRSRTWHVRVVTSASAPGARPD